jgi:hypothetical protein
MHLHSDPSYVRATSKQKINRGRERERERKTKYLLEVLNKIIYHIKEVAVLNIT